MADDPRILHYDSPGPSDQKHQLKTWTARKIAWMTLAGLAFVAALVSMVIILLILSGVWTP